MNCYILLPFQKCRISVLVRLASIEFTHQVTNSTETFNNTISFHVIDKNFIHVKFKECENSRFLRK